MGDIPAVPSTDALGDAAGVVEDSEELIDFKSDMKKVTNRQGLAQSIIGDSTVR
jgi:hypothetical protein